ncbi:Ig-like domain-containing protein [Acinetobacter sp. YH12069]|nr:Ig-like domain-containing protein [Acinetobacter sp. YH12069]
MPEIIEKGEYLVGKADAGNTVVVNYGEQEFITVADVNGDWSMLNPLTTTGAISVVAIDQDGNRSEALHTAQIILPQAVTILESGAVISGTAAPNTTVVI